jgi:hypothetical protein
MVERRSIEPRRKTLRRAIPLPIERPVYGPIATEVSNALRFAPRFPNAWWSA